MPQPPNGIDKEQTRAILARIRRVLMELWDPIGVNDIPEAADEYDSYVEGFYTLLVTRRPRQEIIDRLAHIERDLMELGTQPARLEAVADALLLIAPPPEAS